MIDACVDRWRTIVVLAFAALAVSGLAACGGASKATSSNDEAPYARTVQEPVELHGPRVEVQRLRTTYARMRRAFEAGQGAAVCRELNSVGRSATSGIAANGESCAESIASLSRKVMGKRLERPRIERIAVYPEAGVAGVTMVVGAPPVVDDDNRYRLAFTREGGQWKAQPAFGFFPRALVAR